MAEPDREPVLPDASLEATGEMCPMNYVRTKLRLEQMAAGQVLEVFVSAGEAERNVPRSAGEEGHDVLRVEPAGEGRVRVLIRKREARNGA
jgi:TusA-related sulfurtransferase